MTSSNFRGRKIKTMGRKKLPPEEALKRKQESKRKSKQRPEAKEKHRLQEKNRRAKARQIVKASDADDSTPKRRLKLLESKQKSRADPLRCKRELALQRERRKRKNMEVIANSKCSRLDFEAIPSTSVHNKEYLSTEMLWDKVRSKFFQNISDGPIHRCVCCDRLWFKKSMCTQSKIGLQNKKISIDVIESIFPRHMNEGQFCLTCMSNIRQGKVPPLAVCHGFKYPNQPACLSTLNDLEERLVSLRIPFMQIKECSYDRQLGIKGTIVNVPITLNQTVDKLPKNINDTAILHVKLKKRLRFKSDYMYRLINPKKVFDAASYLMRTPLYQSQDVSLDLDWFEKFKNESFGPGNNDIVEINDSESEEEDLGLDEIDWDNNPFENDEDYPNPEPVETMILGDFPTAMGIALAPGENKVPISLVFDDLGEELSYPKIYCGEFRQFSRDKPPTYAEIVKSELRRFDRRGSTPQKILYSHQKLLHQKLLSCISIQLRHKVFSEDHVTVENLMDREYVHNLQFKNLAFKFMKNIKNSPAHWLNEKNRVCAQIRQFGIPSIFLTLSAAENRWFDLIKHLVFIREDRILTESEFETMTTTYKNDLISQDPVTCALYFEHKMKELWTTFRCNEGPFGNLKITHFYKRTEFQQRGSPHFHILVWLENAPQYDGTNAQEVENFIDKFITCTGNHPFSKLQTHKHTFTCRKKSRRRDNEYCRFNIPFFPMDRTRILLPLAVDDVQRDPEKFKKIREFLSELEQKEVELKDSTFQNFLRHLNMSYDEYLLAIRSGINRPTVFLKRNVNDMLINGYNPKILSLMQSNMDIQFILDHHAVVAYLVDYINKPGRGLSRVLRNCIEAVSEKKLNLKECLTTVANQFLNSVEISAQEAAWSILELPMSQMSEDTIFIPTFRQEDRTRMVKSQEQLKKLDRSSRDVYDLNIIDYYTVRPIILEQECLARFAAWYELQNIGKDENMKLLSGKKYAKLRTKPKVIQYRKFKKSQEEYEYYREQVMLFTSWRDEKEDILTKDFKQLYTANIETIQTNRKEFVASEDLDLEEELMQLEKSRTDEENDEVIEENALVEFEPELEYDENELLGDISLDMKASYGKEFSMFQPDKKYPDEKYRELIRKCNLKQRDLLNHIKNHLRTEPNKRLHLMIEGAAGTGKSFLIDIIVQMLIRIFEKADQDPTQPTVLKLAPTGKAASNIRGETLHHALGIGFSKNSHMSASSITEYAVKYVNLKCVIIDEISMVGANMYEKVNAHLKLFKGNDRDFGGLHVLHFGDFKQLPPVKDAPIFKQTKGLNQLSVNVWHLTQYYELSEIMRQKDDKKFAELLNRVGMANVTKEDEEFLKTRQTTLEKVPKTATLLYHSNRDVDLANKLRLNSIEGDIVESLGYDSVSGTAPIKWKRKALAHVKKLDRTKTGNLEFSIKFKVGLKYMLTYNIDTADGLVNGAVGLLQKIEFCSLKGSKNKEVKRVWLEFVNQKEIGREKRRQSIRYALQNHMSLDWTPIDRMKRVVYSKSNDSISVNRNQFPLILAEAMTIHKSQGATFQEVAIGFKSNLTRPLQYVALSRVTSANGLYILDEYTKPPPPRKDDPIFQEMKRLKANSIIPKFAFLHQHDDPYTLQIVYHNVQSLNAHYDDIAADPCMMNSDILLFAETWTIFKDKFKLDRFDYYHLFSDPKKRKPSGVSIYIKEKLQPMVEEVEYFPNYETGIHVMVVNFKTKVRIAVLYAKPGSSADDIFDAIDESLDVKRIDYKTVLAGDFNINVNTPNGKEFCDLMENDYYMKLRNNPSDSTTIHQTTIDCIFSTNIVRTCGVYESAFSSHLPLFVQIPWEKMKVRTPFPPKDDDPRLECGPDLLDRTGDPDWAEEDDYPL